MKRKYKVVRGKHYDENMNCFKAGDIVESMKPLDKLFRNKFEVVSEPVVVTEESEEPIKAKAKKLKPKVVEESEEEVEEEKPRYFKKHRGGGRWLVMDRKTGEAAHDEKSLTKTEAEGFLEELLAEASVG